MYVERAGEQGPVVVLLHGSAAPGWGTWSAQRSLANDHRLVVPHLPGYPPNPPLERIDFEASAREVAGLIEPGAHLVGHSYGGVIGLLAADLARERLRSLTVIEPPAFGVARGDPAVEELIERINEAFATSARDPREFLARFAAAMGDSPALPDPLPPALAAAVRATLTERDPTEAEIPFDRLRSAGFPILVVSGRSSPPYDTVCDVLVERLGAELAVIPGFGHRVQRSGKPFNERLRAFLAAAP